MELWERIGSQNKKGRVKLSANGRTTLNIGGPTMLGVVASVLAVVYRCKNSQQCWDLQCIVERIQPIRLWRSCVMHVCGTVDATLASLSNYDSDGNENGKKKKSNWFRLTKQRLCTCITLFCTFLSRRCTTTTWKCLISRFVEDGNIRRVSFSFSELWYSLLEFSSRKSCQHLRNWTRWTKRETVWSRATLLFKWRFRSRRRRCCLSSLLLCYASAITEQKKCLELLAQTFDRF